MGEVEARYRGPSESDFDEVFAVLPGQLAGSASREFQASIDLCKPASPQFGWVECSASGQRLRAGVSNLDGATEMLGIGAPHKAIAGLTKDIENGARAGTVQLDALADVLRLYVDGGNGPGTRKSVRGFAMDFAVFDALCIAANAGSELTPAERRLLFQVAGGLSLNEAASRDFVSVETKRAQFKSLAAKLACRGQVDVARLALAQLVPLLIGLTAGDGADLQALEQFTADHLGGDVRLVLQRLPSGRLFRFYEAGPQTGVPLLAIHGTLVPVLFLGSKEALRECGVRLIVPIRTGYLDNLSIDRLSQDQDSINRHLADIAEWIDYADMPVAPLLGISYGAPLALELARRHPALFSRLIMLSTNAGALHDERDAGGFRFFTGFGRLGNRPGLFRKIAWQFRKYYADERTIRPVLRRLFNTPSDHAVLEGEIGGVNVYGWFSAFYQSSIVGVAEDFRFVSQAWMEGIENLSMPIDLLHGRGDPSVHPDFAKALAARARDGRLTLLNGGHLAIAADPLKTWRTVKRIISGLNPSG